jgi:hypothetical protein
LYVTTLESCFGSLCDALNKPSCRSTISAHTGPRKKSIDNSKSGDNTDRSSPNDLECWVRLYQAVLPDVSVDAMDDGGTRTVGTHRAMGRAFSISPVPRHIDALSSAVKAKNPNRLSHADEAELKMYEPMPSAGDDLTLPSTEAPMLGSAPIPLSTTELVPLVVVAPATPAVAIPSAAVLPAAAKDDKEARTALKLAEDFAESIMSDLRNIPGCKKMQVMKNIIDLEKGTTRDVVIREVTIDFWKECMEFLDAPSYQPRLCVVGTPGIGKSTSTAYFIRVLLTERKTVVYRMRETNSIGWYYEFVPRRVALDIRVDVRVYPNSVSIRHIECLKLKSTYYIVDPGETKDSCLPGGRFAAKFILVSSPDGNHWGISEFKKNRGNDRSTFKYYPVWELHEIRSARKHLSTGTAEVTDEEVVKRFRQVGGVPRNILSLEFEETLQEQDDAINSLTRDQVINIAEKRLNVVGTFATDQPKSAIIAYTKPKKTSKRSKLSTFSTRNIEIISPLVAEKIYVKFIRDLWDQMFSNRIISPSNVFETYCRVLMTLPRQAFDRRPCVGKKDPDDGYNTRTRVILGGCTEIRMVPDVVSAAKKHPMVVFHSTDPGEELHDFIYYCRGTFYAFQATIGRRHDASKKSMKKLRKVLGTARLEFYYIVPQEKFETFVTNPVHPFKEFVGHTNVWHLAIPKPNGIH